MTTWLVFDIGTSGTKSTILSSEGEVIKDAFSPYGTRTEAGGVVEQDAPDWWTAVIDSITKLSPGHLDGIVITGQMQNIVLLDAQGEPVRPVILYSDTRARNEVNQVNQTLGRKPMRELTGNEQDAGGFLAKLLWLKTREPASLHKTRHFLFGASDYIIYKMTGIASTDTTTASTTGILDITKREHLEAAIFERLGLGHVPPLLPKVFAGGAHVGELTAQAAKTLGLKAGLPVFHAPGDAGSNTLGAGCGKMGAAYAYIGTSGWVAFSSPQRAAPQWGVITLAHPQPKRYIQVAPLMTAGGNLDWVKHLFGNEEYADAIGQALACPPTKLLYMPYLRGERAPFIDPLAHAAFIGMTDRTEKADLYRAVLEGIIFAYRHCLDVLSSDPIDSLTLTGGGTRSESWCQFFADILGIPVQIDPDREFVGTRGALLSVLVTMGHFEDYAPKQFFPPAKITLQPNRTLRTHYNEQYAIFRELYPALRATFAAIGGKPLVKEDELE